MQPDGDDDNTIFSHLRILLLKLL